MWLRRTSATNRLADAEGAHSRANVDLRRVVVIGSSCSGKTTLAQRLSDLLVVPHIELDAIHWMPNWSPRPKGEFRELTRLALAKGKWAADGNYSIVRDIVWGRATSVVWLDYPFAVVFWRALGRTLTRTIRGQTLYSRNKESLKRAFLSRESILWWVITTFQRRRREFRTVFRNKEFPHLDIIELRSQREAQEFLNSLHPG